ncbi:O-acetyl-ADP-ribose deacetylase [soil metagenome]
MASRGAFSDGFGWALVTHYPCFMPKIILVEGDITKQHADAIVNAANSSLMGGGGVDGAIHRAGGRSILEECERIRADRYPDGLPTGQAVATSAGDLDATWVIHTVGPTYAKSEDRSELLASCHTESLRVADELGAKNIAFPAISTGVYRYPIEAAAAIAISTVAAADTNVGEVRFVLHGADAYAVFERALRTQIR